jgi:hypothetical protein
VTHEPNLPLCSARLGRDGAVQRGRPWVRGVQRFFRCSVRGVGLLLGGFVGSGGTAPSALGQVVTQPPAVVVVGTVLDRSQGAPIPAARVQIVWAGAVREGEQTPVLTAVADEDGVFRIPDVRVGDWRLEASALGYQTLSQVLLIDGASPFTLGVRLAPAALPLEGFVVSVRRNPWLLENGFYDRQLRGQGVTYTGQELEEIGVFQTTDLFRRLSGVTFRLDGSPTSPFIQFRGACGPDIVMDGLNMGPAVRIDDLVTPGEIEGIEIYRGAGTPGLFSSSPCGAVLIWTLGSAARDGRAWSYRRAAVAAGFLLIGVLLAR